MPFCRPDHVFIIYTSDIFLKQIEMLLEKTTHTISSLSSKSLHCFNFKCLTEIVTITEFSTAGLSFPYNLIAPFALVAMIAYMLKLTFKYIISPKVWMGLVYRKSTERAVDTQQAALADEAAGDRLTGENLRMLLNVVHSSTLVQPQQPQQLAVSGVQEVLEALEGRPVSPTNSSTDSKDNSIKNPNSSDISNEKLSISSSSPHIAQEAGFTVVDDDEDVDHIATS